MKTILLLLTAAAALFAAGESKISIAVNRLNPQGVDSTTALVLTDYLSSYLHQTGQYQVLERATINTILKEQSFQTSGACDDDACVVQMGQVLGVMQFIVGTVSKLDGRYIIQTRLIDVKTGTIIQFEKAACSSGEFDEVMERIAKSYARQGKTDLGSSATNGSRKWIYIGAGALAVGGGAAAYLLLNQAGTDSPAALEETNVKFGEFPPNPQ